MTLVDKVKSFFTKHIKPVIIPVSKKHVVIIMAHVKDGVVTVSYNGEYKRAKFEDKTLRDMVYGINFDPNSYQLFKAVATLLKQIIIK